MFSCQKYKDDILSVVNSQKFQTGNELKKQLTTTWKNSGKKRLRSSFFTLFRAHLWADEVNQHPACLYLYILLSQLIKEGLIETKVVKTTRFADTFGYRLTPKGRERRVKKFDAKASQDYLP